MLSNCHVRAAVAVIPAINDEVGTEIYGQYLQLQLYCIGINRSYVCYVSVEDITNENCSCYYTYYIEMGIDVVAWRCRIGCFSQPVKTKSRLQTLRVQ